MSQTDNLENDIIGEDTEDEGEEEALDPRVQDELEKLNQHTDQINKLELQLEDANCLFRTLLTDSTHQLKAMATKIGMSLTLESIEKILLKIFTKCVEKVEEKKSYQELSKIEFFPKKLFSSNNAFVKS